MVRNGLNYAVPGARLNLEWSYSNKSIKLLGCKLGREDRSASFATAAAAGTIASSVVSFWHMCGVRHAIQDAIPLRFIYSAHNGSCFTTYANIPILLCLHLLLMLVIVGDKNINQGREPGTVWTLSKQVSNDSKLSGDKCGKSEISCWQ